MIHKLDYHNSQGISILNSISLAKIFLMYPFTTIRLDLIELGDPRDLQTVSATAYLEEIPPARPFLTIKGSDVILEFVSMAG